MRGHDPCPSAETCTSGRCGARPPTTSASTKVVVPSLSMMMDSMKLAPVSDALSNHPLCQRRARRSRHYADPVAHRPSGDDFQHSPRPHGGTGAGVVEPVRQRVRHVALHTGDCDAHRPTWSAGIVGTPGVSRFQRPIQGIPDGVQRRARGRSSVDDLHGDIRREHEILKKKSRMQCVRDTVQGRGPTLRRRERTMDQNRSLKQRKRRLGAPSQRRQTSRTHPCTDPCLPPLHARQCTTT